MVRVAKVSTGVATTVRDVSPESFIAAYAKHLKDQGQMQVPTWVDIVKTGSAKELAPYDEDWYFIRAASIARKVYLNKGVGCGQLQRWYGGSFRKRCQRSHFRKASGQIIRTILKDLTRMGLVETIVDASSENKEAPVTSGRVITKLGQTELDNIAKTIASAAVEEEDLDEEDQDDEDDDDEDDEE